jgi:hypothetical protein
VNDFHPVEELLICTAALTGLAFAHLVVSGAGHPESLAKFSDWEVLPHRINQRIPLLAGDDFAEQDIAGSVTGISATHKPDARYWIPTENEWYKALWCRRPFQCLV